MKPRILVVDDDLLVLRAIERNLRCSYDVIVAIDVESAEEHLDAGSFDAVISDYHLSDHRTGEDILGKARQLYPEMPRILVTGSPLATMQSMIDSGLADRIVPKPWEPDELTICLGKLIKREELRSQRRSKTQPLLAHSSRTTEDYASSVAPANVSH